MCLYVFIGVIRCVCVYVCMCIGVIGVYRVLPVPYDEVQQEEDCQQAQAESEEGAVAQYVCHVDATEGVHVGYLPTPWGEWFGRVLSSCDQRVRETLWQILERRNDLTALCKQK
jgi:hypothetical protein